MLKAVGVETSIAVQFLNVVVLLGMVGDLGPPTMVQAQKNVDSGTMHQKA